MADATPPDQGNHETFEPLLTEFLQKNRSAMLEHARWLMRGLPKTAEPDDIVQAASLSFCLYLRRHRSAILDTGLKTLARRCVETALSDSRKWHLAEKRRSQAAAVDIPTSQLAPAAYGPGPATQAEQMERRRQREQAVRRAMDELDPLDRRIMELRLEDSEEFTFARIGELTDMTPDAVRMRYRRALDWMKTVIPDQLAGDSQFGRAEPADPDV